MERAMEESKVNEGEQDWNFLSREDLSEEIIFEKRSKGAKDMNHVAIWEKNILGRRAPDTFERWEGGQVSALK